MVYLPATSRVTKAGPNGAVVLTARVWALLADAEKAVGLKAGTLVVTQGSWHHGAQSGSTHDGGGAFAFGYVHHFVQAALGRPDSVHG